MDNEFRVSIVNGDLAGAASLGGKAIALSDGLPRTFVKAAEARYFLSHFAAAPANEVRQRFFISAATTALASAFERMKQDVRGEGATEWRREKWTLSLGQHEAWLKQHRDDFVHGSNSHENDRVPFRLHARVHANKKLEIRIGAAANQTAGKDGQPIARGLLKALEAIEAAQAEAVQNGHLVLGSGRRFFISGTWEYEDENGAWTIGKPEDMPIKLLAPKHEGHEQVPMDT